LKVLFFIDSLQTGGAEKSLLEIGKNLKEFEPIVCTLFSDRDDLLKEYLDSKIPIYELGLKRSSKFWLLDAKKAFEKLIKEIKPDIIHAHLFKSELVARISNRPKTIPLIGAFVNDSYSKERYAEQSSLRNIKLNIIRLIDRVSANKVNHFTSITNSISLSNAKALGIDSNKITTIYRGRYIDTYDIIQPAYEANDRFVFLTVARLLKRKGYIELIDAIDKLKNKNENFICMIAGDGADANEIKHYSSKKGVQNNIHFLGNRSDINVLLQKAHSFIFPSHYEGQGGALVEAMLSAKPIILSDIDVFKEQIADGETGKFFKLKNSVDLAEKMNWMIKNYGIGKEMGMKARTVAKDKFDILKIGEQHDSFYKNVLENFNK
jgi:glycosyltransferase involved in cell wall biosynthesis